MGKRASLIASVLLAAMSACTSTPPPLPTTAPVAEQQPSLDASQCRRLIETTDLAKRETIVAVSACRWDDKGVQAAREVLAAQPGRDAAWAAVWVYATRGTDPAPLRSFLQDADPTVRTMVASALARLGERGSIAALHEALSMDDMLAGSQPPMAISAFATTALAVNVVAAGAPLAGDAAAWRDWLNANGTQLSFEEASGGWRLP